MSLAEMKERLCAICKEMTDKAQSISKAACDRASETAMQLKNKALELAARFKAAVVTGVERAHTIAKRPGLFVLGKYQHAKQVWDANHSFTFFFVPANGQNVAKTNIKRSQLKVAFNTTMAILVVLIGSFGYMAHVTMVSKAQQKELAEYKQTKAEQEETIRQLRAMAEKNQKQLAALSKLEDQVRDHMAKNGAKLPPKSEAPATAAQGGPMEGKKPSQMSLVLEQEKSIQSMASATQTNLKNLLNVIEFENEKREALPSLWPTSDTYVTSSFGGRRNPFGGGRDWHPGIDIAGSYGNPVYASGNGVVSMAQWYYGYGKYIKISHGYGYETAYGHLSSIEVQPGQRVKKGQLIGRVGSTGYSTGPHLHFEVMLNGEQVNPSKLM